MSLPCCADCGHPPGLHGDRAVCPCSGSAGSYGPGPVFRVEPCPCLGYRVPTEGRGTATRTP